MKKAKILTFLALAGFLSSIYLFISEREFLFLFSIFYSFALLITLSGYLYVKKTIFLKSSIFISLIGGVFFTIKESFFFSVFSFLFFAFTIYVLLNTNRGKIFRYPNPILRKKANKVTVFEEEELIEEMIEIVKEEDGAGLAAPQIGVSKRIVVARVGEDIFTFINPKITFVDSEKVVFNEGCLSLKGVWVDVERYSKIMLEAQDKKGENLIMEVEGVLSIILQHETDHLDGILITDHLPFMKRLKELSKYYLREYLW